MKLHPIIVAAGLLLSLGSGAAVAQPRGSYLGSCTRVEQRGPYLRALCEDMRGRLRQTGLDLRSCRGGSIDNQNGNLVCRGGGGRDWGDRGRGEWGNRGNWDDSGRHRRYEFY
jgi:hypothetical protein